MDSAFSFGEIDFLLVSSCARVSLRVDLIKW